MSGEITLYERFREVELGQFLTRSLDTTEAAIARAEETIMRLKRGWATMPSNAEPGVFIISVGSLTAKPVVESFQFHNTSTPPTTLVQLLDLYVGNLPAGKKETNTIGMNLIRKHMGRMTTSHCQ
jgi:hypothetical protein